MSYRLSPTPRLYFTYNGLPAAGGKIYTYLAGTTDEENTYANDSGTPHTNPIVLDANGSAQICLDTSKSYKYVIKSASDDLIDTVDNISSAISSGTGDGKVLVSSADTARGYLSDKITTDGSLSKSIATPGADETVRLSVLKLPAVSGDSSSQYLYDKVTVGAGITKSLNTDPTYGKQVKLTLDASGIPHSGLTGLDGTDVHPLGSLAVEGESLGGFAKKAEILHAKTWYMENNSVQISSFLMGSEYVMRLTNAGGTSIITPTGAIAMPFVAQEPISAGYVVSASGTSEGYCTLNPAYGHASIGVSYNDADTGETVWAVVKGKVRIKIKDSTSVTLGSPLVPCDAVGRLQSVATDFTGSMITYTPAWAYNMNKVAIAIGNLDGSGFANALVL